jgi:hypothetical protein
MENCANIYSPGKLKEGHLYFCRLFEILLEVSRCFQGNFLYRKL